MARRTKRSTKGSTSKKSALQKLQNVVNKLGAATREAKSAKKSISKYVGRSTSTKKRVTKRSKARGRRASARSRKWAKAPLRQGWGLKLRSATKGRRGRRVSQKMSAGMRRNRAAQRAHKGRSAAERMARRSNRAAQLAHRGRSREERLAHRAERGHEGLPRGYRPRGEMNPNYGALVRSREGGLSSASAKAARAEVRALRMWAKAGKGRDPSWYKAPRRHKWASELGHRRLGHKVRAKQYGKTKRDPSWYGEPRRHAKARKLGWKRQWRKAGGKRRPR